LQLGHCLKLQGRRTAALAAYERAAKLAPFSMRPGTSFFTWESAGTRIFVRGPITARGVEALTAITHQIVELRETLKRLVEPCPDIQAQMPFR